MASLLDLANRLNKLVPEIEKSASKLAIKTAESVVGYLVYHTPVDTSQALSNWTVSLDAPNGEFIGAHFYGSYGSTRNMSASEAFSLAKEVLKTKKPGQTIYIENNAPYIVGLNDGSISSQPSGFVEASVLIGRKTKSKFVLMW